MACSSNGLLNKRLLSFGIRVSLQPKEFKMSLWGIPLTSESGLT
jgi:hypothetical protein